MPVLLGCQAVDMASPGSRPHRASACWALHKGEGMVFTKRFVALSDLTDNGSDIHFYKMWCPDAHKLDVCVIYVAG